MDSKSRWGGKSPIAMIRRKGIHFDKPKQKKPTYEQLLELDGLFKPADIEGRLPFSLDELLSKQANGSLVSVLYSLDGDFYLDLRALEEQLRARIAVFTEVHPAR